MTHEGNTKTDVEIANEALTNPDVFAVLIDRYEAKLRRYVHRLTNVADMDADDILQEVFLKAYRNLRNVDSAGSFNSWIYRITHNTVISEHRKKKARPPESLYDEELIQTLKSDISIATDVDQTLLQEKMKLVIERLPEKYRDVIILKYLEDKSYDEMSDILQKPAGTVATLLSRAKKQLAKEIDRTTII